MLRASSSAFGYEVDIRGIGDPAVATGIPGGDALIALVDAVLGVSDEDPERARQRSIDELGPEAFVDAASVFGNFEMMNRVAEGTGIPVAGAAIERSADIIDALGLDHFIKQRSNLS